MCLNSFRLESFQKVCEIQSKNDEETFVIEDSDSKIKYVQKSYNKLYDLGMEQSLFVSNLAKMTTITKHPGILSIIFIKNQPNLTILLEYNNNNTLRDFITQNKSLIEEKHNFNDTKKFIIIIGLAYAIQYAHCHNIFIGNIDANDIFLDENLYPQVYIFPKMNDKTDYFLTWPKDVFSFAYIVYELLTGKETSIESDGKHENRPDLTIISSEWQKQFLQKCWSKYDTLRPNIFDIIQELEANKKEFGNIDENEVSLYQQKIQQYLSNYSNEVKKSANSKDRDFCFVYGNMLTNGYGITPNKKEAARYYKISADQNHVSSIFNYAYILENNESIFSKKKEASQYYKSAADQGHSTSMFNYALMLYNGDGIPINKEEAARYFKISADLGNANSMFNFAFMLDKGEGIEMNKEEAVRYYKMSADHGNITAMNSFASMIKKGIGINRNKKIAAVYFKTAADLGNSSAMFNYAFMLKTGNGIRKNKEEAAKYFKLAANQGNVSAIFNFALMAYNCEGMETNKEEAARYFKLAADNGNVDAMFNYALMLKNGEGIEMNKLEATHYFKMAANKGHSGAMSQYRKLTQFIRVSI